MKSLLIAAGLFLSLLCFGQTQHNKVAILNITLEFRPAIIHLNYDGMFLDSATLRNIGKLTYTNPKDGLYKVYISGPGNPMKLKDSIIVTNEKRLVLSIKQGGTCLYDHPKDYVPICPFNHTDYIIPIIYGLIAERGNTYIKNQLEEKFRYAGCVTSDCDPKYYCKKHKIEF